MNPEPVLLDTSGVFAALVGNDARHAEAAATLRKLIERGGQLHMASYVLHELVTLLQARVGLEAARSFEHEMRPLLEITWIDAGLHERAFRRLELRHRRHLSLADCASFQVMEELSIATAFAYDPDFEREGFATLTRPEQVV